jgi:hypothetical protein
MRNRHGLPHLMHAMLKANCFDCLVWKVAVAVNMNETAPEVRNLSLSVSEGNCYCMVFFL